MKALDQSFNPGSGVTLQGWIAVFGFIQLLLSQVCAARRLLGSSACSGCSARRLERASPPFSPPPAPAHPHPALQFPTIHDLRLLNVFCTLCTIGFAVSATALSIYNGKNPPPDSPPVDYTVSATVFGSTANVVFGAFSALGTIAFGFGDTILPEIQATVKDPVVSNMKKAVNLCYATLASSYIMTTFTGYWAYGNMVTPYLVASFAGASMRAHSRPPRVEPPPPMHMPLALTASPPLLPPTPRVHRPHLGGAALQLFRALPDRGLLPDLLPPHLRGAGGVRHGHQPKAPGHAQHPRPLRRHLLLLRPPHLCRLPLPLLWRLSGAGRRRECLGQLRPEGSHRPALAPLLHHPAPPHPAPPTLPPTDRLHPAGLCHPARPVDRVLQALHPARVDPLRGGPLLHGHWHRGRNWRHPLHHHRLGEARAGGGAGRRAGGRAHLAGSSVRKGDWVRAGGRAAAASRHAAVHTLAPLCSPTHRQTTRCL